MALPSSLRFRRTQAAETPSKNMADVSKADVKRSTRFRRNSIFIISFVYFLALIFLILVEIGNTHNRSVLTSIYFFKLDLSDIIPQSNPNADLINSIARSIGLHDYYQVGLWNFCEGYNDLGVTFCSTPQSFYWFNPVEVIMNELLAGATVALPTEVMQILGILRLASRIMFGFFITGLVLNFLLMLLGPLVLRSRWWSLPVSVTAFISAVLVFSAAAIATVISLAFKYAAESQSDLNIHSDVGVKMFVFMWLASGFTGFCFLYHAALGCCGASQRDIVSGRRPVKAEKMSGS